MYKYINMPTPSPDEIYELLKTVKFIDLNKTVKNTTRLNARTGKKPKRKSLNMTRSKLSLKNKPRFSGVFGKTMNPTSKWKPVPSALSRKYPNIHKKLFSYVKATQSRKCMLFTMKTIAFWRGP